MPPMGPRRGQMPPEKLNKDSIKKLAVYAKTYVPAIIIAIIFACVSAVASILGPNKIQDLVNVISDGVKNGAISEAISGSASSLDLNLFKSIAIMLALIYGIGAICGYIQSLIMGIVTQKLSKKLRTDINNKLNKLPLSYFDSHARGDILSIVTNDVDTIGQALGQALASTFSAIVLFVGVIIMMFITSWILALVVILTSILGFVAMSLITKKSQKYFNSVQQKLAEMNSDIEEIYTNHQLVTTYSSKEMENKAFQEINEDLYNANWKSRFLAGIMMPIMGFVGNLSYALIFVVGILVFMANGNGDTAILGTLISFTIYARLFSQPLQTIAQNVTSLQQTSAASTRVFRYLEEAEVEDESNKTDTLPNVSGEVEFSHVKFSYNPEKEIIHDFNVKLKAGSKIAIVGPTGAGKTTMVNLLMRFYEIDSGAILIDGIKTNNIKKEVIRNQFDMILQDTWLFDGTIKENLVFNNPNVSDDKIYEAIDAVGLKHYISSLPDGINTRLDSKMSLSEGQKQELTIARAIIKDSPMLILDEATSNVDTRTELVIQNAMDNLTKGRTSFVIAHRLSTIKNADIILVMNQGDIIEIGNHKELLLKNGFYAELYNSQFKVFE